MLANKLLSAMAGGEEKLYVDDVFSAYTYTGNGATQTITNGIDLAGKGGMVWIKHRQDYHYYALMDTVSGVNKALASNVTDGINNGGGGSYITAFNSSGYSLGSTNSVNINTGNYVSWTFRKAPKFFDVVTYTGNGAIRTIAHSLGQEVGTILVKKTTSAEDWYVYHRSMTTSDYLLLNTTAAKGTSTTIWNNTAPTTSVFSLGNTAAANQSGNTYVAYLFAHDPSADGIVQCGSFTTTTGVLSTVNLGWEPQYLLLKASAGAASNWTILDTSRGLTTAGNDAELMANTANAEGVNGMADITSTGFTQLGGGNYTWVYLAIRRPNKPPTVGTQVYEASTYAATTVNQIIPATFPSDLTILRQRTVSSNASYWVDRLRGDAKMLYGGFTDAEVTSTYNTFNSSTSLKAIIAIAGAPIFWNFKRAPGVFDVVCYTGTGVDKTEAHGLGVVPELMICKKRSGPEDWGVYHSTVGTAQYLKLNTSDVPVGTSDLWHQQPTASVFSVGTNASSNANTSEYVNYLFATKAGISKVGSYTGNGSSQTINCGFTTGARFILIKRTDAAGDWYVWDTVRGVIAGNDPYLSLNTAVVEVTSNDSIDPDVSGFIVNQIATTNINVSAATYIYLSFA